MSEKPYEQFKLPAIAFFEVGDWELIYVDGEVFHWHDSLPKSELFHRLGIPLDTSVDRDTAQEYLERRLSKAEGDQFDDCSGVAPNTLSELGFLVSQSLIARKRQQVETLQKEIADLENGHPDVDDEQDEVPF